MAFRNFLQISTNIRTLLEQKENLLWTRIQPKSNLAPMGGGFGSLFKIKTVIDHIECAPLIIISGLALLGIATHLILQAMRMQDIRFLPGGKMPSQKHCYIIKGAKPPITKYIVINEKYEWPQGLLEALGNQKGSDKCERQAKRISFKFWKKAKKEQKESEPSDGGDEF